MDDECGKQSVLEMKYIYSYYVKRMFDKCSNI